MTRLHALIASLRAADPRDRALIAFGAANAAGILFLPPELFVWQLAVDLLASAAALGVMYLAADQRAEHLADDNMALAFDLAALTDAVAAHERVCPGYDRMDPLMLEALMPPQRLPLSAEEWDAIVRETEGGQS